METDELAQWFCPACKARIRIRYKSYLDEGTLAEQEYYCPNGCCEGGYYYGNYYERIGPVEWEYSWHETKEEWTARLEQRNAALAEARAVFEDNRGAK